MSSEEAVQEAIFAALDAAIPQPLVEQAIPDSQTVRRNAAGRIDPYVAIQFGDIYPGATRSFAGPRGDDYILPVYIQSIGPAPKIARQISNRVKNAMIGLDFEWSGTIDKRAGGGQGSITASNGATEAYVAATAFTVTIQFETV